MADALDAASTQLDSQRKGLLEAIAQAGSQGQAAYQQAQNDIAAQKQAAVQAAIRDAVSRGANVGDTDQVNFTVGSPYDRRLTDLTQAQAQAQVSNTNMGAAAGRFFDETKASIPALRTYAQAAQQDRALDRQLKELEVQKKMMDLQAETSGPGSLINGLNDQFGGVAGGNRALLAHAKDFVTEAGGNWGHKGTTKLLEEFDRANGLPPGYTRSLLKPAKATAAPAAKDSKARSIGISDKQATAIRRFKEYTQIASSLDSWVNGDDDNEPMTRAEFVTTINTSSMLKKKPKTRRLLIAEYSHLFPLARPKR